MSGILAQGARFHLLGMPRNYALTLSRSGERVHLHKNYLMGVSHSILLDKL